jgi:outer membrane protein assembly factor BamA
MAEIDIPSINIHGNSRTSLSFFENELYRVKQCKTLNELHHEMHVVTQRFQSLDLFDYVDASIKVLPQHQISFAGAGGGAKVIVDIDLKEKKVPMLKLETYVKNSSSGSDVGCEAQGIFRNSLGLGDIFRLSAGKNSFGANEIEANFTLPSVNFNRASLNTKLRVSEDDFSSIGSFYKKNRQVVAELTSFDKSHRLSLDASWRDEYPKSSTTNQFAKDASDYILDALAPSTKTSLKYINTRDSRGMEPHPSSGGLLESTLEVALPPGTTEFLRAELKGEHHIPLISTALKLFSSDSYSAPRLNDEDVVLSVGGSVGSIHLMDIKSGLTKYSQNVNEYSINDKGEKTFIHMSDRYYMGGALNLRGFNIGGAGSRDTVGEGIDSSRNAIGGASKINAFAMFSSPLPFKFSGSNSFRAFIFANCGALYSSPLWPLAAVSNASKVDILEPVRIAVGCGLSMMMGPARMEMTYSIPMRYSPTDTLKPFQIGVALSMNV